MAFAARLSRFAAVYVWVHERMSEHVAQFIGPSNTPRGSEILSLPSTPTSGRSGRRIRTIALVLGASLALVGIAAGAALAMLSITHSTGPGGAVERGSHAALPVTAANPAGAAFLDQHAAIDPMFQAYYHAHQGTDLLGTAVTPAVPVTGGWLQFYASGALFLPDPALTDAGRRLPSDPALVQAKAELPQLVAEGTMDAATGVVRLPLLRTLLQAGSLVSIGQPGSGLTYAQLRSAEQPSRLVPAPASAAGPVSGPVSGATTTAAPASPNATFIREQMRSGRVLGHTIPAAMLAALARPDISPHGWQVDFGNPLTEPISTTAIHEGGEDVLSVQVFEHGALLLDTPVRPAGQPSTPTVRRLPVGLDYLRTFGPPMLERMSGTKAWVSTPTALYAATAGAGIPNASSVDAHVGASFPLTVAGGPLWASGAPWYEVSWQTPGRQGTAWVPGSNLAFAQPQGVASAAFDALDPDLASYLSGLGSQVGAVVYDVSRGMYYEDNPQGRFIVGSSIKVIFLLALLQQVETQHRGLTGDEMSLLTTMIENSNNDSASAVFDEIGGIPATNAFMQQLGVSGLSVSGAGFGWSTIAPSAMVQVLTLLHGGMVLDAQDRALALNLMEHIESDQQKGVGDTAPAGATVAMKDGWVPGPDDMWDVNTSGIVTVGGETYIISVYTNDDSSLEEGWDIISHVCQRVGQVLA